MMTERYEDLGGQRDSALPASYAAVAHRVRRVVLLSGRSVTSLMGWVWFVPVICRVSAASSRRHHEDLPRNPS